MPAAPRIPIGNALTGDLYTMPLAVGAGAVMLNVLLDTGSAALAVDGTKYDLARDPDAKTTQLLQTAAFGAGSYMAAVVNTSVGFSGSGGTSVVLPGANLAVTYDLKPGTFDSADGILGLAFTALDTAYRMPADTWKSRYAADQLSLGRSADLTPCFDQLTQAGLVSGGFAFVVRRSVMSQASDDPATDTLNHGLFVLGGATDCAELFSGPIARVAVVHEQYYNTRLLEIRVGDRSVSVPPPAPGGRVASNSIIDSGGSSLLLDQGLYDKVLGLFAPALADLLRQNSPMAGGGCDQGTIHLEQWPPLRFVFQGSDGAPAIVSVAPRDYWQFDSGEKGVATAALAGDGNGMLGGQSNLGLPIFCGHCVMFDRTASNGHGSIGFAAGV